MSTADTHRVRRHGCLVSTLALGVAIASAAVGCTNGDGDQRGATPAAPIAAADPQQPSAAPTASAASSLPGARNMKPLTIESNTQATIDDVRIGVGNIWEEDYTDEAGAKKKGLTAMLQIFVKDDSAKNTTKRVHPGQKLAASRFEIQVESVDENAVHLLIGAPKKP